MRSIWASLGLCLGLAALWPQTSEAACYGSGTSWTCQAGSTIAEVNTAIGSASDGTVMTFQAGNYTWNSGTINNFSNSAGITLTCETQNACNVTVGGSTFLELSYSGANTRLYRISGFSFQNGTCPICIHVHTMSSGGGGTLERFRLDHNTFTNFSASGVVLQIGATDRGGSVFGVADHNTLTAPLAHIFVHTLGPGSVQDSPPYSWGPSRRGSSNNFFIEDNTMTFGMADINLRHCMDVWRSGAVVYRFNISQNCRVATHGVVHGGVANWEVYRNQIERTAGSGSWTDCTRCIQSQGSGEMYIWDNAFIGASGIVNSAAITIMHYRSAPDADFHGPMGQCDGTRSVDGNISPISTYHGWPCMAQPGRMEVGGTPVWGKLAPLAIFRNYNASTNAKQDGVPSHPWNEPNYGPLHLLANRDYYNAVSASPQISPTSPFNGTTGIGHGTLANRPTNCTHTTAPGGDEGGGVMYWATDQGSWNVSGDGRGSGVLYRCSAANTWTVHYTPYTYPHPLQALGSARSTNPQDIPANLQVR